MTSFWILLFIICLPKTSSTGENPVDHGHYTHDAVMISRLHDAHHLWRQGHQTFSGFIKARERPGKEGGILEEKPRKTEHTKHNPKKIQSQERKTGAKTKVKTPEQRNNTQREGEERNPVYTENCSRYCLHLCRRPCIKKTQHKTQIPNWKEKPAPSSVHHHKDWESKEKQRKKRGQWA